MLGENVLSRTTSACCARVAPSSRRRCLPDDELAYPLCFVAMAIEGAVMGPASARSAGGGLAVFGLAKALKIWAISALGVRWTFRVLVLPGEPLVARGPYGFIRHPNYVAVLGELAGMALIVWAPVTGLLSLRRLRVADVAADALSKIARSGDNSGVSCPNACRLPRSSRSGSLDIVAVVAALASLNIFFTGGFREWTPVGRISVTSWMRPLVIAVAGRGDSPLVLAASQPCWRASTRPCAAAGHQPASAQRWPIFLLHAHRRPRRRLSRHRVVRLRADIPPWRIYENEFLNLPARWDTGWYLGVAIDGYRWEPARATVQQNIAFFPVYPMLMRYGSLFFGREMHVDRRAGLVGRVFLARWSIFSAGARVARTTTRRRGGRAARDATRSLCSTAPRTPNRCFC